MGGPLSDPSAKPRSGCVSLGAVGVVLIVVQFVAMEISTRTDYSVCISGLSIGTQAERDRLVHRYVVEEVRAGRAPARSIGNCCDIGRNAGEFRISSRTYWSGGVVWSFSGRTGTPEERRPYGFLTNCGEVVAEDDYLSRQVD